MTDMIIEIDGHGFDAVFEESHSPMTCAAFRKEMPFESQVVHVRWSGTGHRELAFALPYS